MPNSDDCQNIVSGALENVATVRRYYEMEDGETTVPEEALRLSYLPPGYEDEDDEEESFEDPAVEDPDLKYVRPDCKFEYRTERYKIQHGSLGDMASQTEMRAEWLDEISEAIRDHEIIIMRKSRQMLRKWMKWSAFLVLQLWKPESVTDIRPVYRGTGPLDNVVVPQEDLVALQTVWDHQDAYRAMWKKVRETLNVVNEGAVHGLLVHSYHKWAELYKAVSLQARESYSNSMSSPNHAVKPSMQFFRTP